MWAPQDGERNFVATLAPDAVWLVDGVGPVDVALTFFPRRELAVLRGTWDDLAPRFIQSCTAGLNHMGWDSLPPVPVAAAPGATAPFVAEHVLAFVLAWSRGLVRHTKAIQAGHFDLGAPVRSLASLRVGIVGLGGIGRATGALLHRLGCTVEAVTRTPVDEPNMARVGPMDDLGAMAARVDVLVVAVPLTVETEGLIDIDILAGMMGRPALLVNVARGPVVCEADLYAWLDSSSKHWAALDVWWHYPAIEGERPFDEAFERLPNVIMTPHNSPNVEGFRLAMIGQALRQAQHFVATGEALHVHNPAWYLTAADGDGR